MPRFSRPMPGGLCVHVVTRGNGRAVVFHSAADYEIFTTLMRHAGERTPIDILAWCLMPNHVHLVVRPLRDGDLGRWMHWLLTTHVNRHHVRHGTTGRLWQGRYKAFPVQVDAYLIAVMRYVERNPVRAGLVGTSTRWPWSSARERASQSLADTLLTRPPVDLPSSWDDYVDTPMGAKELHDIRTSIRRDRPLGDAAWTSKVARELHLERTLNPRGRPRGGRDDSRGPSEKGECPLLC